MPADVKDRLSGYSIVQVTDYLKKLKREITYVILKGLVSMPNSLSFK